MNDIVKIKSRILDFNKDYLFYLSHLKTVLIGIILCF